MKLKDRLKEIDANIVKLEKIQAEIMIDGVNIKPFINLYKKRRNLLASQIGLNKKPR